MITALVIQPDNTVTKTEVNEQNFADYYRIIGTNIVEYVPAVQPVPHNQLVVDEEGAMKGSPVNPVASLMAGRMIVGTAILVGPVRNGVDTSIPVELQEAP